MLEWWTPKTNAFKCLKDKHFSLEFIIAISKACLMANFVNVHGFFNAPNIFMKLVMTYSWTLITLEMFQVKKFSKKSTIDGSVSTFCITNFLETFIGSLCKATLVALISRVALFNFQFGIQACNGCKALSSACAVT